MRKIKRLLELYTNYYVKKRIPTIVYSMERSGSIVVFESLLTHGEFAITTHYLDPELDPEKMATGRYSGSAVWVSKHLIRKRKKMRIISMVRNPVESMVSFFARSHFGDRAQEVDAAQAESNPLTSEDISRQFTEEFLEKKHYRHHLQWFDSEFIPALGVDIYKHDFNKEQGYVQIQEGPNEVLILRTELDDAQKSQIISEFLGLTDFHILRATRSRGAAHGTPGEKAPYAKQYKLLKESLKIPENFLEEITASKYATHFFTPEYLCEMRQQYAR